MPSPTAIIFSNKLLRQLLALGVLTAKPSIPSTTLREALRPIVDLPGQVGRLHITHYWALFVHDGRRGGFGPKRGRYLVWFRDPKQDPRLRGGKTPARAAQLRQLTGAQWRAGLKANRAARAAGQPPVMIVTPWVAKGTKARPFFSNDAGGGMASFPAKARELIGAEFSAYVGRFVVSEKDVAVGGLG